MTWQDLNDFKIRVQLYSTLWVNFTDNVSVDGIGYIELCHGYIYDNLGSLSHWNVSAVDKMSARGISRAQNDFN